MLASSSSAKVVIEVVDQKRALRFRTEKVGFEVAPDRTSRDERWLEVRPTDGRPVLVLSPRRGAPPSGPELLPTSNMIRPREHP
jgi:hypothetical protein